MGDYISREGLIERLGRNLAACNPGTFSEACYTDAIETVRNVPAVDAELVVRCGKCKHSYEDISGLCCTMGPCTDCIVPEDFFCSYGERGGETHGNA